MAKLPVGVAAAAPPLKLPPPAKNQIASEVVVQPCQEPPTSTTTHSSADIYFNAWKGTNAFEAMLKDGILYPTYLRAITKNADRYFKDKLVLDLGCGFGVLSLLALKAGARAVVAVEGCDEVLSVAEKLAEENFPNGSWRKKLKFVKGGLLKTTEGLSGSSCSSSSTSSRSSFQLTENLETIDKVQEALRDLLQVSDGAVVQHDPPQAATSCSIVVEDAPASAQLPRPDSTTKKINDDHRKMMKFDTILSVPFGSCLFFDSRLEEVVIARDFLLKPTETSTLVPDACTLYAELGASGQPHFSSWIREGLVEDCKGEYAAIDFSPLDKAAYEEPTHTTLLANANVHLKTRPEMMEVSGEEGGDEDKVGKETRHSKTRNKGVRAQQEMGFNAERVLRLNFYTMTRSQARGNYTAELFFKSKTRRSDKFGTHSFMRDKSLVTSLRSFSSGSHSEAAEHHVHASCDPGEVEDVVMGENDDEVAKQVQGDVEAQEVDEDYTKNFDTLAFWFDVHFFSNTTNCPGMHGRTTPGKENCLDAANEEHHSEDDLSPLSLLSQSLLSPTNNRSITCTTNHVKSCFKQTLCYLRQPIKVTMVDEEVVSVHRNSNRQRKAAQPPEKIRVLLRQFRPFLEQAECAATASQQRHDRSPGAAGETANASTLEKKGKQMENLRTLSLTVGIMERIAVGEVAEEDDKVCEDAGEVEQQKVRRRDHSGRDPEDWEEHDAEDYYEEEDEQYPFVQRYRMMAM
ncbi:unnamed protein product [Amoebophrya sp. A120]|nr:unnamed protein product [Amoebophrya sp. A120]|eukprot:GSA120T00007561001.1